MRKEREITVNVINEKRINYRRLAEFFAMKYTEKSKDNLKEKS